MAGLPESLRARIAERTALPPIEKVRSFLHTYVADADDFDEIRSGLRATAQPNSFYLEQDRDALQTILGKPQPPGTLLRLVEGDGNWGMDHDQTDRGAAAFLGEVFDLLRAAIDEVDS